MQTLPCTAAYPCSHSSALGPALSWLRLSRSAGLGDGRTRGTGWDQHLSRKPDGTTIVALWCNSVQAFAGTKRLLSAMQLEQVAERVTGLNIAFSASVLLRQPSNIAGFLGSTLGFDIAFPTSREKGSETCKVQTAGMISRVC